MGNEMARQTLGAAAKVDSPPRYMDTGSGAKTLRPENQSAYNAAPSATVIRDNLVSAGVMKVGTLGALTLDVATVAHTAAVDTVVGAIVGATPGSTIVMTDTDGGKFKITGNNVVVAAAIAAGAHNITLTETLANGSVSNSPRASVIVITVT